MNARLVAFLLVAAAVGRPAHAVGQAPVEIRIALRASTFWVAEPIRMEVHWKALKAATVAVEKDDLCFEAVRLLVRGPHGERAYHEPPRDMCEAIYIRRPMKRGEEALTRLVFFGSGGWLDDDLRSTRYEPSVIFPQPGEYALRLIYIGDKTPVLSNEVNVTVEMPPKEEHALLQQILREPLITCSTPGSAERVQQYPTSRYLAWSRLAQFGHKVYQHTPSNRETEDRRRFEIVAEMLAQEWGQFEEEALALAYNVSPGTGRTGLAAEFAARLRAKFPGSWTLDVLGLDEPDEDDDEPQQPPGVKKP